MSISLFIKGVLNKTSTQTLPINFEGEVIMYKLMQYPKAKNLRVTIGRDGGLSVRAPYSISIKYIESFLHKKKSWILSKHRYYRTLPRPLSYTAAKEDYEKYKQEALLLVQRKIAEINSSSTFTYNKISIKNQKTLWGSCSKQRVLSFNYKILHLPENLAEYIIVHELCHLKEFNHSKQFWHLVSDMLPNYKELRLELRKKAM